MYHPFNSLTFVSPWFLSLGFSRSLAANIFMLPPSFLSLFSTSLFVPAHILPLFPFTSKSPFCRTPSFFLSVFLRIFLPYLSSSVTWPLPIPQSLTLCLFFCFILSLSRCPSFLQEQLQSFITCRPVASRITFSFVVLTNQLNMNS